MDIVEKLQAWYADEDEKPFSAQDFMLIVSDLIQGQVSTTKNVPTDDQKTAIVQFMRSKYCHLFSQMVFEAAKRGRHIKYPEEFYEDDSPVMTGAIAGGQTELILRLIEYGIERVTEFIEHVVDVEMLDFLKKNGFQFKSADLTHVASKGSLDMTIWIYTRVNVESEFWFFNRACKSGNVLLVQWLRQMGFTCDDSTLRYACYGKNLALVKYLIEEEKCTANPDGLIAAAFNGAVDIFRYLLTLQPVIDPRPLYRAAVEGGSVEILELLTEMKCPVYPRSAVAAMQYAHLDVMKWLHTQGGHTWDSSVSGALQHSASSVEIFEWLLEIGCEFNETVICECARAGRLDLLKWLHAQTITGLDWEDEDDQIIEAAIESGRVDILIWLSKIGPEIQWG